MDHFMINIKTNGDAETGWLSFFEGNKDIPFSIKRNYYVYGIPLQQKRGLHAHKKLKQILWCPAGEIEVVIDNGKEKEVYLLDSPEKALVMLKGFWRELIWKKEGSVLCVAASDYYDEEDYIRNYDEFLNYVEEGYWANGD